MHKRNTAELQSSAAFQANPPLKGQPVRPAFWRISVVLTFILSTSVCTYASEPDTRSPLEHPRHGQALEPISDIPQAWSRSTNALNPTWKLSFNLQHFEGYEGVSRQAFRNQFEGHQPRGNTQNQFAESEVSIKAGRGIWLFETFVRQDAKVQYNRDTADLYASLQQERDAEVGRRYQLDFNAQLAQRRGVGASVQIIAPREAVLHHPQLTLNTGIRVWSFGRFRDAVFKGNALAQSPESYQFNAGGTDANSREQFEFPQRPGSFNSLGIGLNISGQWEWSGRQRTLFRIDDLLNYNRLRNLPNSDYDLTSEVKSRDSNGDLQVRSALLTKNSYISRNLSLKPRTHILHEVDFQQVRVQAGFQSAGSFVMPLLGVLSRAGSNDNSPQWGLQSNLYYRSIGPVVRWRGLTASVQTDSLSASDRKALGAALVWRVEIE